ncbi:hypothetical protein [Burkholderia ubonensis]|uniref:hypothetical protein n=1 Tax=Burkholderia ubonensis TaxID=101571 RepID=UPI00114CC672|nr:hypothetical protein [Burkholderia ubonensis]
MGWLGLVAAGDEFKADTGMSASANGEWILFAEPPTVCLAFADPSANEKKPCKCRAFSLPSGFALAPERTARSSV